MGSNLPNDQMQAKCLDPTDPLAGILGANLKLTDETLRDLFAAAAMISERRDWNCQENTGEYAEENDYAGVAVLAYRQADAMMEVRKK